MLFLEKVRSENPGVPCFLHGHSTEAKYSGQAVSYPHIEKMVDGIILSSPALRVKVGHPIAVAMAPILSLVAPRSPRYQLKGANKRGIPVSRDPAALTDPLVYTGPIKVRTVHEILRLTSYLTRNFKSVADRVTDPSASQELFNEAASEFKDIKLYEGFLHNLLFEPGGGRNRFSSGYYRLDG
ncbi:hypothetical protein Leryth_021069 [Lithospermum erythrorhizon]|nr:hypothetical protein Leryth_021069 [Lithospermum erythrorhizon]